MWEGLDPVWGTGTFEKFYCGAFGVLLSSRPEDLDGWWGLNKECMNFIDYHIKYLSNPLYSLPRDSVLDVRNGGSELELYLKMRFPKTVKLLLESSVLRLCEDLSVELSLHQLEVFGFIDLAIQDPSLQNGTGQIELTRLSSTILELYCRELRFLLLIVRELANNSHSCVVLGVLCDSEFDFGNKDEQISSDLQNESKAGDIFTSQCPPICIYGCSKILESGFVRNAVNSVFQSVQEIIKLGQANIKADSQSMADLPSNSETSDCLRDHYRNVILQLTDTVAILLSRFSPTLEEVEALMELIPNVARMQPSFLTNRPTAADFDSWDGFGSSTNYASKNLESDSNYSSQKHETKSMDTRLTLSAKILLIVVVCFDSIPKRWKRGEHLPTSPSSVHDTHNWFHSAKRLPKASKDNLFQAKHHLVTKLSHDTSTSNSDTLSLNEDQLKTLSGEFWDVDAPLGRFAAFSINGAFGQNSRKRFLGLTHWRTLRFIQDELLPRLDPQDPVGLIFIQVLYDICSVALSPTQDPIQWSRILQLQRRILMEKDNRVLIHERDQSTPTLKKTVSKSSTHNGDSEPEISILSPLICCLDTLCRRYPLASWGASKVLSSCIEMFPTLSMYSSFGETEISTSVSIPFPQILSELFVDLLDLAATIMTVGHYSLGQQVAHFLQNQPSNFWFHLPSILQFISRTLLADDDVPTLPDELPKIGLWNGAGLDNPCYFRPLCRAVLRILSSGFSSRLCISHPPPPPLLSTSINLYGSRSIPDFLILLLRDCFENNILDNLELLYTLVTGSLDVFSQGILHNQAAEVLSLLSLKTTLLSKVLQYSISENDSGIFLIKLLSAIISLQFRVSNINANRGFSDSTNKYLLENTEFNYYDGKAENSELSGERNNNLSKSQLPLIRWIMLYILPIIHKLSSVPPVRRWTISALVLKLIKVTLSNPLPENQHDFSEDSDATIWLLRCLLSIDSPSFHQLMTLIIPPEDPFLNFLQVQNSDTARRPKLITAKTGLEIIKLLFQRDNLFHYWVNYHKRSLRKLCNGLLSHSGALINLHEILLDTEALNAAASTDSSLILIHEQLALPAQWDAFSSNSSQKLEILDLDRKNFYRKSLLRYIMIGTDPAILKLATYIACQLLYRDPDSLTAVLTDSPALLLQVRSSFSRILSSPDLDKFPTAIQGFVLESEDSFNTIWNTPGLLIPGEAESGSKCSSLVRDQQAVFWDEITEADPTSSLFSCEFNLLGASYKTLLPLHLELEVNFDIYQDALTEAADLSLWNLLKTNMGETSTPKISLSKINESVLNGYLQLLPPTFIPNKSSIYNNISRFYLTSTRSMVCFALAKGLEDRFLASPISLTGTTSILNIGFGPGGKIPDSTSSAVPLLLGLNLGMATDVPTIMEYVSIWRDKDMINYSLKGYDEIYMPDGSSSSNEATFPLLTIIDILSEPPEIPLTDPSDEKPYSPCVDFAILSQLELYYLSLRLTANVLKVPQLLDFSIRLLGERLNSRFSILRERIVLPVTWIPLEYRWLHFLHLGLIIHIVSLEIFVVSQVSSALKVIQTLEFRDCLFQDPLFQDPFWLSCVQNLCTLFRAFLTPPKSSSSSADQLNILSPILNVAHSLNEESSLEFEQIIQEGSSSTSLFCSFVPYLTSHNLVCGIYRTSLKSMISGNFAKRVTKFDLPLTIAPSIDSVSSRLFVNEYVQFLGLLLNKFSTVSLRTVELESRDFDGNIFLTLQAIIELFRPYINFSFFNKTSKPLVSAILSIFSQIMLTTLRNVHEFTFMERNGYFQEDTSLRYYFQSSSTSEIQRQKVCLITIQDCCEDLVKLLIELEKASSGVNESSQYFPQEWKNTLLHLLSNCIALDYLQFSSKANRESNVPFTSSFLRQIWPEIWAFHRNDSSKSTSNSSSIKPSSTFTDFVSLLVGNLRIPSLKRNHRLLKKLNGFLPLSLETENTFWILKPQEAFFLNRLYLFKENTENEIHNSEEEYKNILELCNWMSFRADFQVGMNIKQNHSFLSLYLLLLIYNKIHTSGQQFCLKDFPGLVPPISGDEHIQNLQTLIHNSEISNQSCFGSLIFWNYITINWLRMSTSFLRKMIESNYINYLISQEVVLTTMQECLQLFLNLQLTGSQVSNLQLENISDRIELIVSLISLLVEVIHRGILPNNTLAGYGSIDNFESIVSWIEKMETFFSSLMDFFVKNLLFCHQHKKSGWQGLSKNQNTPISNGFGNLLVLERFSPLLCSVLSIFSKVISVWNQILNLNLRINSGMDSTIISSNNSRNPNKTSVSVNFTIINLLHSRGGQILDAISQMVSILASSTHLFSIIFSCIYCFEAEIEFLSRYDFSNLGFAFNTDISNSSILNPGKLRLEIARWLSSSISHLSASLKDGVEAKPSKSLDFIKNVISALYRASLTVLCCFKFKEQSLPSNSRDILTTENPFNEVIKSCLSSIGTVLNLEMKIRFIGSKMFETSEDSKSELEMLKHVRLRFESILS
ncbi:hypothetical protein HWI79_2800 [Cryptosporidium felis]|nr:hypothetical protein HWI79_2800 [Cryptosporidium felis]